MKQGAKGIYRNEVEKPEQAAVGHLKRAMGCDEFKGQAMDISYGQAGKKGCSSDQRKIQSQMMHYSSEE